MSLHKNFYICVPINMSIEWMLEIEGPFSFLWK